MRRFSCYAGLAILVICGSALAYAHPAPQLANDFAVAGWFSLQEFRRDLRGKLADVHGPYDGAEE